MKFMVDAQLPRRLAHWLRGQGHDVVHTLDLPKANRSSDAEVIALSGAELRIVISKDSDFVNSFQVRGQPAKLLLISTGNLSNVALERLWARHHDAIIEAFSNASFVELAVDKLIVHT